MFYFCGNVIIFDYIQMLNQYLKRKQKHYKIRKTFVMYN